MIAGNKKFNWFFQLLKQASSTNNVSLLSAVGETSVHLIFPQLTQRKQTFSLHIGLFPSASSSKMSSHKIHIVLLSCKTYRLKIYTLTEFLSVARRRCLCFLFSLRRSLAISYRVVRCVHLVPSDFNGISRTLNQEALAHYSSFRTLSQLAWWLRLAQTVHYYYLRLGWRSLDPT